MNSVPNVRYVESERGVNVAYSVLGSGPVLLFAPLVFSTPMEFSNRIPESVQWHEQLAEQFTVVRYDSRNVGLSDEAEFTQSSFTADLEAVALTVSAGNPISVVGQFRSGTAAIEVAAAHPEMVKCLVLWNTTARWSDFSTSWFRNDLEGFDEVSKRMIRLHMLIGWGHGDVAYEVASLPRTHRTQEEDFLPRQTTSTVDASEFAQKLTCPTLVLHRNAFRGLPSASARQLAVSIPDAQLSMLEGSSLMPWLGDSDDVLSQIAGFVRESLVGEVHENVPTHDTFRTILFTDVVASTPLLAQLKDERMRAVMRDHDEVLEAAVTDNGGRVVKTIGDAFMAEFAVPSGAVKAAIAAQRGIRDKFADSDVPIRLRIGINAGEPIEEDGDLHGASVVVAKRLESSADDGGILISDVVKSAVLGKDFVLEDRGDFDLKGFDEPVRAWSVAWE